jgi:hypothetical protein
MNTTGFNRHSQFKWRQDRRKDTISFLNSVVEAWNSIRSERKKNLKTTGMVGVANENMKMENNIRRRILPKRSYVDHQREPAKYIQVR